MKARIGLVLFLFFFCKTNGQINYVLNPSLELLDRTCIQNDMPIKQIPYWNCIDSNGYWVLGSPWHANTCDIGSNGSSAPFNPRFYHYPRTGNGMAFNEDIIPGFGTNYREYLQGHLHKPLLNGKTYCLSFYVCQTQQAYYSVSNIGAYLDNGTIDTAIHTYSIAQTQYTPQVVESALLTDTLNWTKIEGSFIADGTERIITIGIFTDDAHTNKAIFNSQSTIGQEGCYLIDDISVIESDAKAYAFNHDTLHMGYIDSFLLGRDETIPGIKWWRDGVLIDTLNAGLWIHDNVLGTYHTYVLSQTLCGLTTWDTVVVSVEAVSSEVGSEHGSTGLTMTMWPNPVEDELNLSYIPLDPPLKGEYATVRIFDIVGKIVYGGVLNENKTVVSTKGFASGVYFVQVVSERGERVVRKIVKQ